MQKKKYVAIAAGGSFGHLKPALHLFEHHRHAFFIGLGLKESKFFDQTLPFVSLKGGRNLTLLREIFRALWILKKRKVDLVIGFGSYHSFPVLLAAFLLRCPIRLFEPNIIPGLVIRWFNRFAEKTYIWHQETNEHLSKKGILIEKIAKKDVSIDPYRYFSLSQEWPILLIMGGSQGAKSINEAVLRGLSSLEKGVQVIHFVGDESNIFKIQKGYEEKKIRAYVKTFEPRVDLAMQIADVAFTRAGAMTLSELSFFQVPAILVPFEAAQGQHQHYNAAHFLENNSGLLLLEGEIDHWPSKIKEVQKRPNTQKVEERIGWAESIL